MKVDKKANFCIFFLIALIALGLSNFAAAYTGDLVSSAFPSINDTEKMIALDNDNFSPASLNAVYEQKKVVEEVNETDNETENSTIEESTITEKVNNTNNNQDIDSSTIIESDTNPNSNPDTDDGGNSKPKPSPSQTDSTEDE